MEHTVDRTGWTSGEWDGEPDKKEWRYKGLPCLAVRGPLGAWCGYVGLLPGHPWREKGQIKKVLGRDLEVGYDNIDADVHGGLSYGPKKCQEPICHEALPGESEDVMWIGFDCSHYMDLAPGFSKYRFISQKNGETYKNLSYVEREVEHLADQALTAERK